MALLLTPPTTSQRLSPTSNNKPVYAESLETSKAFYKLATTPSPKIKQKKRSPRSQTPSPHDSRSLGDSDEEDQGCVLSRGRDFRDVPSGLGLGLGLPELPRETDGRDPLNWRFSTITKRESAQVPPSPSPSDSVIGERRVRTGDDVYSVYTLTPGPAWPPPPSSTVSPADTPRTSQAVEYIHPLQAPMSPLTPAISQLLEEISSIPRPPSIPDTEKQLTTVQAWVMDLPPAGRGRGRGRVNVRRMRSLGNLRAAGSGINGGLGSAIPPMPVVHLHSAVPSPPITSRPPTPVNYLYSNSILPLDAYEDDRIIISPPNDPELPPPQIQGQFDDVDMDGLDETDIDSDSEDSVDSVDEITHEDELGTSITLPVMPRTPPAPSIPQSPMEPRTPILPAYLRAPESPLIAQSSPDPDHDLVHEIEILLESSPLRKKERMEAEKRALEEQPKENLEDSGVLQPPSIKRLKTEDKAFSIRTITPDNEEFFTPREQGTPFFEKSNPINKSTTSLIRSEKPLQLGDIPALPTNFSLMDLDPPETPSRPPIPRKSPSRPNLIGNDPDTTITQTPAVIPVSQTTVNATSPQSVVDAVRTAIFNASPKSTYEKESPKTTPKRPAIPQRRSSLTHSRNPSVESVNNISYPPVSLPVQFRPQVHNRGRSFDSGSVHSSKKSDYRNNSGRRLRSSSANELDVTDSPRGRYQSRGRSRSLDDGPPKIPSRTSSLGKTGSAREALDGFPRQASARPSFDRSTEHTGSGGTEKSLLTTRRSDISIRESMEIFGSGSGAKAERVEKVRLVSPHGSLKAKKVIVRSPSQKQGEFERPATSKDQDHLQVPQVVIEDAETSRASTPGHNHIAELPVVFQLIPPTPFVQSKEDDALKQLGVQIPQIISIPATPEPTDARNYIYAKPAHPSTPIPQSQDSTSANLSGLSFDDKQGYFPTDLAGGLLVPPHEEKQPTPPPGTKETRTTTTTTTISRLMAAPERITDYDTTAPPPQRPKLKTLPTKFRQSKLHPWWRPTPEKPKSVNDSPQSSYSDPFSNRPGTASTITTVFSGGSGKVVGAPHLGGPPRKRRSIRLSKDIELEFVGVRGLKEQWKERKKMKEVKKAKEKEKETVIGSPRTA